MQENEALRVLREQLSQPRPIDPPGSVLLKPDEVCNGVCGLCTNDPCKKAPTVGKLLAGLE